MREKYWMVHNPELLNELRFFIVDHGHRAGEEDKLIDYILQPDRVRYAMILYSLFTTGSDIVTNVVMGDLNGTS